jgi:hypothetical protein
MRQIARPLLFITFAFLFSGFPLVEWSCLSFGTSDWRHSQDYCDWRTGFEVHESGSIAFACVALIARVSDRIQQGGMVHRAVPEANGGWPRADAVRLMHNLRRAGPETGLLRDHHVVISVGGDVHPSAHGTESGTARLTCLLMLR